MKQEEELRVRKEQENLRLEKDRVKDQKNREVYARWMLEKKRLRGVEVAERQRRENERRIEREQKDRVVKERASENFRSWKMIKKEESEKHAQDRCQREKERMVSKKMDRLRAAEAYEQWLINHPFQILPQSAFVNPNPWIDNEDQD